MASISALWSKPHYACKEGADVNAWLGARLGDKPDFVGLAQYEADAQLAGTLSEAKYGTLGSGCYAAGQRKYGDVIGIAYNQSRWELQQSFPETATGATCASIPQTDVGVICGSDGTPSCCACTGHPDALYPGTKDTVGSRAYAIGVFKDKTSQWPKDVCVVAASLPHPYPYGCDSSGDFSKCVKDAQGNMFGTDAFYGNVDNLCAGKDVVFLGDTNMGPQKESFKGLFPGSKVLSQMEDASGALNTCCFESSNSQATVNRYASDRMAFFCQDGKCSGSQQGGSTAMNQPLQDGQLQVSKFTHCKANPNPVLNKLQGSFVCCGSAEEHAPILAKVTR